MKKMLGIAVLLVIAGCVFGYDLRTKDGKRVYRDYKGLGGPSQDGRGLVIYYGDWKKAIVLPHNFPADFPDKAALKKQLARLPAAKREALANRKVRQAEEKAENAERKKHADRVKKMLKNKSLIPTVTVKPKPKTNSTRKLGSNNNSSSNRSSRKK